LILGCQKCLLKLLDSRADIGRQPVAHLRDFATNGYDLVNPNLR